MTIEQIEERIQSERAAIAKAEQRKVDQESKRRTALEAGNDAAVDKADTEIQIAVTAVTRGAERIEILEQKRTEAIAAQREADLDALAAKANQARVSGEQLISQYAKHAAAIGELLPKLAAIDADIDQVNRVLRAADRASVLSPNATRSRATARSTRTERRRLGTGDLLHPLHGKVTIDQWNGNIVRHRETGELVEPFGDFDVEVPHIEPGYFPAPLQSDVRLPRIDPASCDFWPNDSRKVEAAGEPASGVVGAVRALFKSKAA